MHLNWEKRWTDIVEVANQILPICEARLDLLSPQYRQGNKETLKRVRQQLAGNLSEIRRAPHNWAFPLASIAIWIARGTAKKGSDDRNVVRQLANFCGIVFDFRRNADPGKFEGNFRNSLELFLAATLPDLTPTVIAADVIDEVREWLTGFYEKVPEDLSFLLDDIILRAYEDRRRTLDSDNTRGEMVRFVEENKDLVSLPVSSTSESIRKRWENLYSYHIGAPPSSPPKELLNAEVRASIREAVLTADPMAVRDVLAPLENGLVEWLNKHLHVSFDFSEPASLLSQ